LREMKLDREMEMLLNEIPLLHHGGLIGGGVVDAEAEDLNYLIHELAERGVADGDDEPQVAVAAGGFSFAGLDLAKKRDDLMASPQPFSLANHPAHMPSLFDRFPFDTADGWCLPPAPAPSAPPSTRCKNGRRKSGACPAATTSPTKSHGESLAGLRGFMYHVARDQHGCRFLQQRLDDGKREVDLIFVGVSRHAAQLMVDPFGNYLMQKLLATCDAGQRMELVLALTADPLALVRISLNVHG
jgi:hypothetical protein